MIDISKYKYTYELHLHTSEGSACSHVDGARMAECAKEAGYTGVVVTNHAWGGNTSVDRSLPWREWVEQFTKGYENAKKWGDENGLAVFFGYESGYNGTEFLIYGITPEWMKNHSELHDASVEEQFDIVHRGGGIVVHAHPFREEWYIPEIRLFPEWVDAVEGVNATHSSHLSTSHNNPDFDTLAIAYAKEHSFPMTAGSDVHGTLMFGGGILTDFRIETPKELTNLIMSDRMYLLTDGDRIYSRYGEILSK